MSAPTLPSAPQPLSRLTVEERERAITTIYRAVNPDDAASAAKAPWW